MESPLVAPPADTSECKYVQLAYLAAFDAVLACDYAFVAYRETDSDGAFRVRIRSTQTAGAVFEPAAMRQQARTAAARGQDSFPWGYSFDPSPGDPRCIRFRVLVRDGAPAAIEMHVQLRAGDGSAAAPHTVTFPWPA